MNKKQSAAISGVYIISTQASSWVPRFAIGHPPGKFFEPQTLKVLWRPDKSQLDLFAIAQDGSIWSIWWSDFISGW
ncbi:MAG: hypothetical protein ABIU77_27380 [Ferruginibacter sp.]